MPDALESEDIMDMVAVGLLPATLVDNWIAEIWVQIIKGLKLDPNAVLRQGADLAGAVRPTNPQLLAMLNKAIAEVGHNATTISNRAKVHLLKIKQLHAATQEADMERFRTTLGIFDKAAIDAPIENSTPLAPPFGTLAWTDTECGTLTKRGAALLGTL